MPNKSFSRESMSKISEEFTENLDSKTSQQLISTIRKLVFYDTKRKDHYKRKNRLEGQDRNYNIIFIEDGAKSKYGKIKLKVINSYTRDEDEDPLPHEDRQIVEVFQNEELVFQAVAYKTPTWNPDFESEPDAELTDFNINSFKPGSWILPILAMGAKKEIKNDLGANNRPPD